MKIRRRGLLDILCVLYPEKTREEHLASVLCGDVYVAGELVRDPRRLFAEGADISFAAKGFVSRGGDKLEAALEAWGVDAAGKTVLDAGCSTGGFTHCLLERGATVVHAVDVGYGQLHPSLRADSRVFLKEKTNIMTLEALLPRPAFAVCDLSFRSLRGAARHILGLTEEGRLIALVKPQFEWEDPPAEFDGVVRLNIELQNILLSLAEALEREGVFTRAVIESPLKGHAGNREFLFDLNTARGLAPAALRRKITALTRQ
jgi:23S rRNA (cytidine1920-2'-O)/16S rRNA (cytidine1409-2'-O)-methyltransferase